MKNNTGRLQELTDLEWQAFRYLANELNEADRVNFETQLGNDESAQQSVVQMSTLMCQLASTSDSRSAVFETPAAFTVSVGENAAIHRSTRRRIATAWTITVASAFLIGLATWVFNINVENSGDEGSQLAEVWVDSVGEISEQAEADLELAKTDASEFSNDADEDWLLAALISLEEFDRELIQ